MVALTDAHLTKQEPVPAARFLNLAEKLHRKEDFVLDVSMVMNYLSEMVCKNA